MSLVTILSFQFSLREMFRSLIRGSKNGCGICFWLFGHGFLLQKPQILSVSIKTQSPECKIEGGQSKEWLNCNLKISESHSQIVFRCVVEINTYLLIIIPEFIFALCWKQNVKNYLYCLVSCLSLTVRLPVLVNQTGDGWSSITFLHW